MKIKHTYIFLAVILSGTAAYADPLDVKPGLWETTTTTEMSGMPPLDTSKMTPEQKARIETAMKKRQAQGPRVHVRKSCVTKERLNREPFQGKEQESCTRTVISSTGTHWQTKLLCTNPKRVGEFDIEAVSRERIRGSVKMNESSGKHAMAVHVSIEGKWLGSSCGSIK